MKDISLKSSLLLSSERKINIQTKIKETKNKRRLHIILINDIKLGYLGVYSFSSNFILELYKQFPNVFLFLQQVGKLKDIDMTDITKNNIINKKQEIKSNLNIDEKKNIIKAEIHNNILKIIIKLKLKSSQ